ncbi:hypothetical protein BS1321_13020 [Peribacillus simplex NBRC 15720 = DSM 1321]|uniref:Uncharacterized protein n=1 Tax=Peribacillus simplex NBRC 15720 = DSM 1321 TaxID=1349754 RepID=A0A223EHL9_9BACI|nr:hypothetical protein BS1321_13020 [Peribacillus simplex NBRC 15720 = DSM 1321]
MVAAVKDITKLVDRQMQSVGSRQSKKWLLSQKKHLLERKKWRLRQANKHNHGKCRKIGNVT